MAVNGEANKSILDTGEDAQMGVYLWNMSAHLGGLGPWNYSMDLNPSTRDMHGNVTIISLLMFEKSAS